MQLRDTLLLTPAQSAGASYGISEATVYGIKLMIVRMIVVVRSSLDVGVDVSSLAVGVGDGAPGECIVPATAEITSVRLRATMALVWRSFFTCGAS